MIKGSNKVSVNLESTSTSCGKISKYTAERYGPLLLFFAIIVLFSIGVLNDVAVAGNNAGAAFSIWPDTGQTKCYDNDGEITCPAEGEPFYGQDAQYQGPQPSYTKLGVNGVELPKDATPADGWIMTRDNVTGLIWEIKTDDGSVHDKDNLYTWCDHNSDTNGGYEGTCGNGTDTEDFINALNAANFGGYSDWRLPTAKELSSLVNSGIPYPGPTVDIEYFPLTMASGYWSATTDVNSTNTAWHVSFNSGDVHDGYKHYGYYVRAVRSERDKLLNRFQDNHNGTITDTITGFMWQKCSMGQTYNSVTKGCDGSPNKYTWQDALAACETLDFAGYDDWRLPSRNELHSIVDYSKGALSIDTNYFPDTESFGYWSSTSDAKDTNFAWRMYFGGIYTYNKTNTYYVRAVRSGPSNLELGDVNGDGRVTIVDALLVARYSVNLMVINFHADKADVNCDGAVTIVDALLIARKSVGLTTSAWCNSGT